MHIVYVLFKIMHNKLILMTFIFCTLHIYICNFLKLFFIQKMPLSLYPDVNMFSH